MLSDQNQEFPGTKKEETRKEDDQEEGPCEGWGCSGLREGLKLMSEV